MSEPIFGIDLGTTNSCIAVLEPGGPRILPVDGEPIVPSVVSFERGETIVGRRARNRLALAPESTVRSIKRRMGESLPVELPDRALLPEEIAAEILRHLKTACGREVRRAVITVPAYFGDAQRRATLKAGELAGLEVVRLLNEPTAAALLYDRLALRGGPDGAPAGPRRRELQGPSQRILVYDLGGGTFDVSVVEIGEDLNEVRASCGDNRLGGDDFDLLLARHLAQGLGGGVLGDLDCSETSNSVAFSSPGVPRSGIRNPDGDPRRRARLLDAAERAKIELSARPYTRVIEEALAPGVHLDVEVERSRFEELIEPHLERTLAEVDRALAEARLAAGEIDRVVLVGGSTSIPRVMERLAERFACPVEHAVDPALGVALGAAVLGGILGGQVFDQILVDVSAHSLGIKTLDNVLAAPRSHAAPDHFAVILRRNTPIPATRSEVYYTLVEDQRTVSVEVYQGEDPRCSRNTLIGDFDFELAPAPAHSPIVVELSYDLDGVIHVIAEQKGTGRRQEVTMSTRPEVEPEEGSRRAVDNYILRKARALAADLAGDGPAGGLAGRLREAAAAYETALDVDDDDEIEAAEAGLLDLLEEAEEAAALR